MLVDDEPAVLAIAERVLVTAGFAVTAFSSPLEALQCGLGAPDSFDLLVTDVVMPDLTGPRLAERLRARRPGLPVLLMSGNPMTSVDDPLLPKPFSPDALVEAVQRVLRRAASERAWDGAGL